MSKFLKTAALGLALTAGAPAHADEPGAEPVPAPTPTPTSVVWRDGGERLRDTSSSKERDPRSCEDLDDVIQMVGDAIHTTNANCRLLVRAGVVTTETTLTPEANPNLGSALVTLDSDTRLPQVVVNFVDPNRQPLVIRSPKDADAIRDAIEAALKDS